MRRDQGAAGSRSAEIALAVGLAALVALALAGGLDPAAAHADTPHERRANASAAPPATAAPASSLPDTAARQLDDEAGTIARALGQVSDKLTAAETTRKHRLRAAYRALHRAPGEAALAAARRRAAARFLLDRDGVERALLADEAARLRAAHARVAADTTRLPALAVPTELAWPAAGKIARRFGTLWHERSKTTLSRRGIDIDVEDGSPVIAPAAGTVRYAGPIRGLDDGVIIDHGGYVTVIAKLAAASDRLPAGTKLAAGDRIGRAARQRVYLEVRLAVGAGGLPIDPEPLLPKLR